MPIKLFDTNRLLLWKPAEPIKAIPLQLPPEIIGQIVAYVLESEDDWVTLYRTTPRWRQPKFEAEIEGHILRQRRLESVRLASVSATFLSEVVFNLRKGIGEQHKVITNMRDMERKDERIVQFLVSECEMLGDVAQRLVNIRDGKASKGKTKHWRNKLSGLFRHMRKSARE